MPTAEEAAAADQEEASGPALALEKPTLEGVAEPQPLQPSAARTTRWQGTAGKSGQRPIAPPTARAAPGRPIAAATSPYVTRSPHATPADEPYTSASKRDRPRRSSAGASRPRAG